jgi:transcriptional regulator with XRE-family HTH domain
MSAKDMFYPEDKKFSNAEEKAFAREELVYNVTEDLLVLLEDMEVSKKELASRLGKSKSYISQVLSGARNMTLGSLSDICYVLGVKPQIILPVAEEPASQKIRSEHWIVESKNKPVSIKVSSEKVIAFPKDNSRWPRKVA